MTEVSFRSDMTVQLVQHTSDPDIMVGASARVSTLGSKSLSDLATDKQAQHGLLDYLMRNRHMSPFEHNQFTFFVQCPIFVAREFMRHRTFSFNEECLAGDTVVTRVAPDGSNYRKNGELATMYRNWYEGVPDSLGRTRKLPSCRDIYVRSFDETTLEPTVSKVSKIIKSTGKTTWRVELLSGKVLRSSLDHKYFTPSGWKLLKELKPGDLVYRTSLVAKNEDPNVPPRLRQGIQIWATAVKRRKRDEWNTCAHCLESFPFEELEIDHKIPVSQNLLKALEETNLQPLCRKCHRAKTDTEQGYGSRNKYGLRADTIRSISDPNEEDTYDLVLEGNHNFLANGVVVHNSGRYKELEGIFYIPDVHRPTVQTGKAGEYNFHLGSQYQHICVQSDLKGASIYAYGRYQNMLGNGIAREVARMCLPVNIYTSFYATANARNLMKFLSLRTKDENATYPSYPQREIEMVAEQMEILWAQKMPITAELFVKYGRVGL